MDSYWLSRRKLPIRMSQKGYTNSIDEVIENDSTHEVDSNDEVIEVMTFLQAVLYPNLVVQNTAQSL